MSCSEEKKDPNPPKEPFDPHSHAWAFRPVGIKPGSEKQDHHPEQNEADKPSKTS